MIIRMFSRIVFRHSFVRFSGVNFTRKMILSVSTFDHAEVGTPASLDIPDAILTLAFACFPGRKGRKLGFSRS